jgi:hypothetical protein
MAVIAGAATAATANPQARISRRKGMGYVAIVTLSVVNRSARRTQVYGTCEESAFDPRVGCERL